MDLKALILSSLAQNSSPIEVDCHAILLILADRMWIDEQGNLAYK
jgi:hypothetical protein